MKVYIVAVPYFDADMAVRAYRLCDRSGDKILGVQDDFRKMGDLFLTPGLDLVERIGLEPFAGDKPLFVDLNQLQLLTGVPTNMNIDPTRLVCVLPSDLSTEQAVLDRCAALRERGYTLALSGIPASGTQTPLLEHVDTIILDCTSPGFTHDYHTMNTQLKNMGLVVTDIPNTSVFDTLKKRPNILLTGSFYSQPITAGITEISPVKVNALQLLSQVNQEDFELEDIVKIIERDPSLSISLLRFINSPAVGLGNKVNSIKNAVAILGQKEVRRWATVAISVSLAEDRPGEITKLSLVRAKFAENLATVFELGVFQSNLFLVGLFSLLDVILQMPMSEAINEIAVDDRVRETLLNRSGRLYPVMDLIYTYERADWDRVSIILIQNKVDIDDVTSAFTEALVWYNQLLDSISAGDEAVSE